MVLSFVNITYSYFSVIRIFLEWLQTEQTRTRQHGTQAGNHGRYLKILNFTETTLELKISFFTLLLCTIEALSGMP